MPRNLSERKPRMQAVTPKPGIRPIDTEMGKLLIHLKNEGRWAWVADIEALLERAEQAEAAAKKKALAALSAGDNQ